jgi:hypothetical protein
MICLQSDSRPIIPSSGWQKSSRVALAQYDREYLVPAVVHIGLGVSPRSSGCLL